MKRHAKGQEQDEYSSYNSLSFFPHTHIPPQQNKNRSVP